MFLVNQDGARSGPVRAKVTQRIRGDCVYLVHGWGQTAKRLGLRVWPRRVGQRARHPLRRGPDHGRHRHERELRAPRARREGGMRKRYAMAVDTVRCVGCSGCVIACKTENALPSGGSATGSQRRRAARSRRCPCRSARSAATSAAARPASAPARPARATSRRAGSWRDAGEVHRLQGLHRRVPVRRALRPPRRLRRQVHLLPAPGERREGARVRRDLPDARAHVRRPRRSRERRRGARPLPALQVLQPGSGNAPNVFFLS